MPESKRVGLYCRVSTADQNVDMQTVELRQYAEARGWTIVETFEDHGFSGKNTARPGLKALIDAASKRRIDVVLVWKLDRFARSLTDLVNMIELLTDCGVEFVSLRDAIDLTTSQGRLMLHLLGAFAQFERDLIGSRVRAGLANARRNGKRLGRPQTRNDNAIRSLRAKGMSIRAIAAKLSISKAAVQRSLECTEKPAKPAAVTG